MHKRFIKNLSKLLIVAITIPSTPISLTGNIVYGKEININQSTQTTTGSSLEITEANKTTSSHLEIVESDLNQELTTMAALNVKNIDGWDGVSMSEPAFEDGTYLITSAEEFKWLEDAVNTGTLETTGITLQLQNDIDFNNHGVVIGTETYPFKGNFDGKGHSIINISLDECINKGNMSIGLFGYADGGEFRNLKIQANLNNLQGNKTVTYYGALIGKAVNVSVLDNINLVHNIYEDSLDVEAIGGLVGYLETDDTLDIANLDIEVNFGNTTSSENRKYFGGIVGNVLCSEENTTITMSNNNIVINSTGTLDFQLNINGAFGNFVSKSVVTGIFNLYDTDIKMNINSIKTATSVNGIATLIQNFQNVDVNRLKADIRTQDLGRFSYAPFPLEAVVCAIFNKIETKDSVYGTISIQNAHITGHNIDCTVRGLVESVRGYKLTFVLKDSSTDVSNELTFENLDGNNAASVVGRVQVANMEVQNCENKSKEVRGNSAGGIIYYADCYGDVIINNCNNMADIYSKNTVGGIIQYLYFKTTATITNCNNYGNLYVSSDTGGLFQTISGRGKLIMDNCNNYGNITKVADNANDFLVGVGGIAQFISLYNNTQKSEIRNCNSYCDLYGDVVGGLIDKEYSGSNIINCNYKGNITATSEMGGLIRATYCSIVTEPQIISDCTVDATFESEGDCQFASFICDMETKLDVIIENNTVNANNSVINTSNSVSSFINKILGKGDKTKQKVVIKGNSVKDMTITSDKSSSGASLLIGSILDFHDILITENSVQNLNIFRNSEYGYNSLIGDLSIYSIFSLDGRNAIISNNLIEASFGGSGTYAIKSYGLTGHLRYIEVNAENNLFIIEGDAQSYSTPSYTDKYSSLNQTGPNYYISDIGNCLEEEDNFTPITSEEAKSMITFQGMDFDSIWGYTEDNTDHPVLQARQYSLNPVDTTIVMNRNNIVGVPLTFGDSHPSLLKGLEHELDNESVVSLNGDEIIPIETGKVVVSSKSINLPISKQLNCEQTITVVECVPELELKDLVVYQSNEIPDASEFVKHFRLNSPVDNSTIEDDTETSEYEIVSLTDSDGNKVEQLDEVGVYEVEIRGIDGVYSDTQKVSLVVEELVSGLAYDDSRIEVSYGTDIENIELPNKVTIKTKDNSKLEVTDIVWDTVNYNPNKSQDYEVFATIKLPNNLAFNDLNEIQISKVITVLPEVSIPEEPPVITPPVEEVKPPVEENTTDDDDDYSDEVIIIPSTPTEETKPVETPIEKRITVSFKIGHDRWFVDDKAQVFSMDQAPELKNNRAYVPLRFLSYALQVEEDHVKWDNQTKEVEITDGENTIKLKLNSNKAYINGKAYTMDGMPYLSNGRIMVPISQIQGLFEHKKPIVSWDQDQMKVDIKLKL